MSLQPPSGASGAGLRDRWVTIQARPETGADADGFPADGAWADLATVAMARDDLAAQEVARTAQEVATSTTRWEMPYMLEMDPETVDVPALRRLVYRGRVLDIVAAVPVGRAEAIMLETENVSKAPSEGTR